MTKMLDQLFEAKAVMDGDRDNLLKAMGALAPTGHITIIPRDDQLTSKPVIVLPQRMYDRLRTISKESSK